jgi:hypothetical protein
MVVKSLWLLEPGCLPLVAMSPQQSHRSRAVPLQSTIANPAPEEGPGGKLENHLSAGDQGVERLLGSHGGAVCGKHDLKVVKTVRLEEHLTAKERRPRGKNRTNRQILQLARGRL